MAIVDLKPVSTIIGDLLLDAAIVQTFTNEVEVTEHPVEKGANIVDHFRVKPEIISIQGLITETQLPRGGPETQKVTLGKTGKIGTVSQVREAKAGDITNSSQARDYLLELRDSGDLIVIQTPIKKFENMKMTSLSIPRDGGTGDSLLFTATFRQVRIVSIRTAEFKTLLSQKSRDKHDKGTKPTQPVPEPWKLQSGFSVGLNLDGMKQIMGNVKNLYGLGH